MPGSAIDRPPTTGRRSFHRSPSWWAIVLLALGTTVHGRVGRTAPLPAKVAGACHDEACALAAGHARLDAGDPTGALRALRPALRAHPESGPLALLTAAAYLQAGNGLWAIRVLDRRYRAHPGECETRAALAWAFLREAALSSARPLLEEPGCDRGPIAARLALLTAWLAHHRGDRPAARAALARADRADSSYPSDRRMVSALARKALPDDPPELSWRLEVTTGYTTNPLLGSPIDAQSSDQTTGSWLLAADAAISVAPDFGPAVRPWMEAGAKVTSFASPQVAEQSYADFMVRAGLLVGRLPRALAAYRMGTLVLPRGYRSGGREEAGPLLFAVSHRGELEIETSRWATVFAGAGRREFHEMARSRTEIDGALGGRLPSVRALSLLWAVSGRGYLARNAAYDLGGGSVALAAQVRLPRGFSLRAGVTGALDYYPDSAGFFGGDPDARRDLFARASLWAWSPSLGGLRAGFGYEFSHRDSTVEAFGFSDHRASLRLAWSGDARLRRPRIAETRPAFDIDWGDAGAAGDGDRVQDLLRQDEQVQRASSCAQ